MSDLTSEQKIARLRSAVASHQVMDRRDALATLAALDAARAEIERLRTAAADEHADVVAWLMRQDWVIASSAINRGAHVGAAKGGERG